MLWPTSSKHFQIHIHHSIPSWAGTVETFANNQDVVCLVESWKKFHGIICHSYGKCTRGWWKITHSFFQTSLQLFSLLRIRKLIKVISYFALSPRSRSTYHFLLFPFLHFLQSYFWEISMPCVSSSRNEPTLLFIFKNGCSVLILITFTVDFQSFRLNWIQQSKSTPSIRQIMLSSQKNPYNRWFFFLLGMMLKFYSSRYCLMKRKKEILLFLEWIKWICTICFGRD